MTKHDITGLDPELKRLWEAVNHERELREAQIAAADKALVLQAEKTEGHLRDLNHAHERALKAQQLTVPRETFEIHRAAQEERFSEVTGQLSEIRGGIRTALVLGGFVFTIINIAITLILQGMVAVK